MSSIAAPVVQERTPCYLPKEIWQQIFDYLDLSTCLFSCSLTCTFFFGLVHENSFWVKRLWEWFLFDVQLDLPSPYLCAEALFRQWYKKVGGFEATSYGELFFTEGSGGVVKAIGLRKEDEAKGLSFAWMRPLYFFDAILDRSRWPPATSCRFEYHAAPNQLTPLLYIYSPMSTTDQVAPHLALTTVENVTHFELVCRLVRTQSNNTPAISITVYRCDSFGQPLEFAAGALYMLGKMQPRHLRPILTIELQLGSKVVFRPPRPVLYLDRLVRNLPTLQPLVIQQV